MSFLTATRQNITELPAQAYDGNKKTFVLPKVGLLSRLFLTFTGTNTVTLGGGTAAVSQFTAYNLIKRIRVLANSGASIFDVTGYGAYVINLLGGKQATMIDSLYDAGTDALVYAAPVAAGANTWQMGLEIPIAINERDPIGLVLLQNNSTTITVEVEFNTLYGLADDGSVAVLVTGAAVAAMTAATVGLSMEYFTVPRSQEDYPALNVVHQYLEEQLTFAATGPQIVTLQRGNTYLQLIHMLTCNTAINSAAVERLRILYNQSEVPYNVPARVQSLLQRKRYGSDLPKGVFVHDWYMSNGCPNLGNSRDFINSAAVTEFQSEVTVAAGTTVTGTTNLRTIKRQLIQIA
jgi:hypothetical protein